MSKIKFEKVLRMGTEDSGIEIEQFYFIDGIGNLETTATFAGNVDGDRKTTTGNADNAIDACCVALERAVGFKVHSWSHDGKRNGQGTSEDFVLRIKYQDRLYEGKAANPKLAAAVSGAYLNAVSNMYSYLRQHNRSQGV